MEPEKVDPPPLRDLDASRRREPLLSREEEKEALQTWEGEGGNPPPPRKRPRA